MSNQTQTQPQQTKARELSELIDRIKNLYPEGTSWQISFDCAGNAEVTNYSVNTYAEATELLRELGIGRRAKEPHEDHTVVKGDIRPSGEGVLGITVRAVITELPPTCHIEEYVEKVPKTEVKEVPGEFVEVKRKRVVCSEDARVPA